MRKFLSDILVKASLGVEQNAYVLGTVGIGTSTPSYKLHVDGTIYGPTYTSGSITINSGDFLFSAEGGGDGFQMDYYNGQMYFGNNAGTSWHMVMQDNGNIGIGTTSPTEILHLSRIATDNYIKIEAGGQAANYSGLMLTEYGINWGWSLRHSAGTDALYISYQDNTPTFTDAVTFNRNGNVGIGTTSPSAKLHISGSTDATQRIIVDGSGNNSSLNLNYNGSNVGFINSYQNSELNIGTSVSAFVNFYTNNTERMRITSAGNVGIGTTSPAAPLHVYKSDTYSAIISRADWNIAETRLGLGAQYGVLGYISTGIVETTNDTTYVALNYKNGLSTYAEGLRVYNNGNVGIGTTTPAAKLDVNGSIYAVGDITIRQSGSSSLSLYRANSGYQSATLYWEGSGLYWAAGMGYGTYSWVINDTNYGVNNKFVVTQGTTWGVGIGTASPTAKLDVAGSGVSTDFRVSRSADPTAYFSISAPGGGPNASIFGVNGVDVMTLRVDGNVGIGTTSPAYKLDVYGDIRSGGNDPLLILQPNSGTYAFLQKLSSSNGNYLRLYDGTNYSTFWKDNKVGIGTASPAGKLSIEGDGSEYSNIVFKQSAAQEHLIYASANYQYNLIGSGAPVWIWGQQGASERMRLDNTGLGIGTTSPSYKLDVNGTARVQSGLYVDENSVGAGSILRFIGGSSYYNFQIAKQYTVDGGLEITPSTAVGGSTYSTPALVVKANGNVGIGTSIPTDKLQVVASTYNGITITTPDVATFKMRSTSGATTSWGFATTNLAASDFGIYQSNSAGGDPINAGTARLYFNGSGNVGIGTTSPTSKLHVNGIVRSDNYYNVLGNDVYFGSGSGLLYGGSSSDAVLRSGSNVHLAIDGYSKLIVNTSGNVGIGTTSPQSKLHVYGAGSIELRIGSSTANTNSLLSFYEASLASWGIEAGQANGPFYIKDLYNSATRLTINASGNVGIGTTSPNDLLTLQRNDGRLRFNTSAGTRVLYLGDDFGSGGFQQIYDSTGAVKVQFSAGVSYFNGDNVGIGTNNPGAKLEIDGSFNIKNGDGNITHFNYVDGSTNYVRGTTYFDIAPVYFTGGSVGIGTTSPSSKLEVSVAPSAAWINLINANETAFRLTTFNNGTNNGSSTYAFKYGLYYATTENATITFYRGGSSVGGFLTFTTDNGNERMRIDASGNVGIGTTSPASKLDVIGALKVGNSGISNGDVDLWSSSNGIHSGSSLTWRMNTGGGNPNSAIARIQPDVYNPSRGYVNALDFYVGDWNNNNNVGNALMSIMTSGNVGIGTTYPTYKLEVNGTFGANGTAVFNGSATYINSSDIIVGNNSTDTVVISGNTMYFPGNGNVGIGTTSPASLLHINGSGNTFTRYTNTSNSGHYIDIGANGAGESFVYGYGAYPLLFATNGSERMRITSGGVVSIATTSPYTGLSTRLYVGYDQNSSVAVRDEFISVGAAGGSTNLAGINFLIYNAGYGGRIYTDDNLSSYRGLVFDVLQNGTFYNAMSITRESSPKIGIGTTSPSYKLHVSGTVGLTDDLTFASTNPQIKWNAGLLRFTSLGIGNVVFTIAESGAATFSSSVTASNLYLGSLTNEQLMISGTGSRGIGVSTTTSGDPYVRLYDNTTIKADIWWGRSGNYMGINSVGINTAINPYGGNVGIGTTNPTQQLETTARFVIGNAVTGRVGIFGQATATADTYITIQNTIGNFDIGTSSGGHYFYGIGSLPLQFYTNSTEKMRITSGGNVGIGTTAPGVKLQVEAGSIRATGTTSTTGQIDASPNYGAFRFYDGTTFLGGLGTGQWAGVGAAGDSVMYLEGSRAFHVSNGATPRLTVSSAGNVGIGTTSPGALLQVGYQNTTADDLIRLGISYNTSRSARGGITWHDSGNTTGKIYTEYDGSQVSMVFGSLYNSGYNSNQLMVIRGNGNVGIGTSSPDRGLTISKGNQYASLNIYKTNTTNQIVYLGTGSSGADDDAILQLFDEATEKVRIFTAGDSWFNGGNVGIGTTTPGARFTVQTTTSSSAHSMRVTDGTGLINIGHWDTVTNRFEFSGKPTYFVQYGTGNYVSFGTLGSENMRIEAGGNVGIGTSSPTGKLTISQNNSGGVAALTFAEDESTIQGPSANTKILMGGNLSLNAASTWVAATNGSERMRITSAGNVGIGTISPAFTLDVNGNAAVGTKLSVGTAYNGFALNVAGTAYIIGGSVWTQNGYGFTNSGSTNTGMFPDSNHIITFKNNNSANVTINASGYVGIGTTSPSSILQLGAGSYTATNSGYNTFNAGGFGVLFRDLYDAYLTFNTVYGESGWVNKYSSYKSAVINFNDGRLDISTGTGTTAGSASNLTTRLVMTNDGNVGIGTTSPTAPLDANGVRLGRNWAISNRADIRLDSNGADYPADILFGHTAAANQNGWDGVYWSLSSRANNLSNAFTIWRGAGNPGGSGEEIVFTILPSGNIGIGTTSPQGKLDITGTNGSDLLYLDAGVNTDFAFKILSGSNDALILRRQHSTQGDLSIASFTYNGNVGIGTTEPQKKLEVLTAASNFASVGVNTIVIGEWTGIHFGYREANSLYRKSAIVFERTGGAAQGKIHFLNNISADNSSATLSDSKMVISDDGNVGIGTTSPAHKLDISGNISVTTYTGTKVGFNVGDAFSAYGTSVAYYGISYAFTATPLALSGYFGIGLFSEGAERMRIAGNGNVGIGTTSPGYKLDVSGIINTTSSPGSYGTIIRIRDTVTSGTESFGGVHFTSSPGTDYTIGKWTTAAGVGLLQIRDQAGNQFVTINSSGNVGIGTASPTERLEVNGSIRLSDGNADGPQLKLASSGYSDWNIDNYNGSLRAYYGGTEYTRLTSSGYFGIGTTSPSYKLHVEGNVSGISIYASHDIAAFSDITVKKDVERIENAIDKVKELNGYTYVRTDDATGTRRAGVIAQEVQKVLPEVVSQNPDGTLNVAYANMIALLIEGMKEQQATIERMQQEINELKK